MSNDKEKEFRNLEHIFYVLEERTIWYKKRQLETKRAMKSIHRLDILPDPSKTQTMLEAEISYIINNAGLEALKIIIEQFTVLDANNWKERLRKEFIILLQDKCIFFEKKQLSQKQFSTLFEVVFSLDENCQRKEIANFIRENAEELVTQVFKNIVILDDVYAQKVIKDLINHL
ncbi:MAG: hypothetical protein GNW80_05170 [Asgard group archaeon]|nr:hypothetical protein [Asgard group archaeon]